MKKNYLYHSFLIIFFLSGCVTLRELPAPDKKEEAKVTTVELKHPDTSPQLQNIKEEDLKEHKDKTGVIFAKTEFQGLLKTTYVKLLIENHKDPQQKFQLHIGEPSGQKTFPWEVKPVNPGYFFIELPVGLYKIASISIPVGTTMATEDINIIFEVFPETITYTGTLKVTGTKEKIKLGGVPVIKPGFEYTVEIFDEREEGVMAFHQRYPNIGKGISTNLMRINIQGDSG